MNVDQVDELLELDVDAPIPFCLTSQGYRMLEQMKLDERLETCDHDWLVTRRAAVMYAECGKCGLDEQVKPRQSIPNYLGKKA